MAQSPSDNVELVRQLATGNEAAFRSLYERYQRRIDRSLMPIISAACHQVIFFAKARRITSCIFIARSIAAFE